MHLHQRKRKLPKTMPVAQDLPAHEIKKQQLVEQYRVIPSSCIYVDRHNAVILFKNQETGGWCARAETVLYQYKKGK